MLASFPSNRSKARPISMKEPGAEGGWWRMGGGRAVDTHSGDSQRHASVCNHARGHLLCLIPYHEEMKTYLGLGEMVRLFSKVVLVLPSGHSLPGSREGPSYIVA